MTEYTIKNNICLFWKGEFSNWAKTPFKIPTSFFSPYLEQNSRYFSIYDNQDIMTPLHLNFGNSEQAMMFAKAIIFNDFDIAEKIMKSNKPSEQKDLGRKVKNYNDEIWNNIRFEIVTGILYHKFNQHPELKKALTEKYKNHIICEASPLDKIWGIGLAEDNPLAWNVETWQGRNLLGESLMAIRAIFKHNIIKQNEK